MRTAGILAMAVLSGCTAQRYLVLPPPAAVEGTAPAFAPGETFRVGEVSTRVLLTSASGAAANNVEVDQLKAQLTERVRTTLSAQANLGAVAGPAKYSLELELEAREAYGFGKGFWLGIGLEVGVLVVGAAVGAGVAAATRPQGTSAGTQAMLGSSYGMVVSLPVALLAAFLAEGGGVKGEYEGVLTLRRRADRVPVAARRVTTTWRGSYNVFGAAEKIATMAGAAVPEFERALLEALQAMLLELSEPVPPPAPVVP